MKKLIVILFALFLLSSPSQAVEYDANADGKIDVTYLPIGTSLQAYDPDLVAIAALNCTVNQIIKRNEAGTWICSDEATSMVYPGAGIAKSTGSAWDTSYAIGTGAGSIAAGDHAHSGVYQAADADIPTTAASQVEMEAGTEVGLRSMSPLRVAQAIAALGSAGVSSFEDLTEGFALSGNGSKIVAVNSGATALEPVSTISLDDSAAQFYNTAAPTKLVKVDASGLTAGETAVIKPVGNYTLTYTLTGNSGVTYPTTGTLATVKNEKLATFSWDGGGSALSAAAGTKRCTFVPSAATLTGLYFSTGAESTSNITVALYKDAFAAGAHATTAMISGTNAVTIPAAGTVLNINDTTLTNFTKTISAGDQVCAEITATDTTTWLQLTLYGTK